MGFGIETVRVLIGIVGPLDLGGQAPGHAVVGVLVLGKEFGGSDYDLRSVGPEEVDLLGRNLVRNRADHPVPPHRPHHGEAGAGIARGGLHDRPAVAQQAHLLGPLDHVHRNALLDGSRRVHEVDLGDQIPGSVEARETDQGRTSYRLEGTVAYHGW